MKFYLYHKYASRLLSACSVAVILILFLGCSGETGYQQVDFSKTITVERPQQRKAAENMLTVAIGAMVSPKKTYDY